MVKKLNKNSSFPFLVVLIISTLSLGASSLFLNNQFRKEKTVLSETITDLQLCNLGQGKLLKVYKEPYSLLNFKIGSPLFVGKEVEVKEWLYQGNKIKEMTINMSTTYPIIKVWQQAQSDSSLGYTFNSNHKAQVITKSPPVMTYKPKNNMTFFVESTELLTDYINFDTDHQIYIQILGDPVTGMPPSARDSDESLKSLEAIADSINEVNHR